MTKSEKKNVCDRKNWKGCVRCGGHRYELLWEQQSSGRHKILARCVKCGVSLGYVSIDKATCRIADLGPVQRADAVQEKQLEFPFAL